MAWARGGGSGGMGPILTLDGQERRTSQKSKGKSQNQRKVWINVLFERSVSCPRRAILRPALTCLDRGRRYRNRRRQEPGQRQRAVHPRLGNREQVRGAGTVRELASTSREGSPPTAKGRFVSPGQVLLDCPSLADRPTFWASRNGENNTREFHLSEGRNHKRRAVLMDQRNS